jgi:hypothetical protein
LRGPNSFKVVLEHDLMCRLIEGLTCEPRPMSLRPVLAGVVTAAVPKQESEELLSGAHELHRSIDPGAGEIAHGLMRLVSDPHPSEVTGSVHDRKLLGVTPICFDTLPGLARNHRRSDYSASMTEGREMTINPVTAAPGLITEFKPMSAFGEFFCELGESDRRIRDGADEVDFPSRPSSSTVTEMLTL